MPINSIASEVLSTSTGTLAALARVTADGKAESAVVERTGSGYEAYLPDRPGPVASGSSIDVAESRLNSTVQFQA